MVASSLFVLGVITFIPVFAWAVLWYLQDREREPFKALALTFLCGVLASVVLMLLGQVTDVESGRFVFLLAVGEEVVKALLLIVAIEGCSKWFTQVVDGLVYGAVIGLGFAFAENMLYFFGLLGSSESLVVVYLTRSLSTVVAHSLFSALFGFFYASAYLRNEICWIEKRKKPWMNTWWHLLERIPFHVTLFHLLPNNPSLKGHHAGSLIVEGLFLAGLLHGVFNALFAFEFFGVNVSFLSFPLICFLAVVVWRVFGQRMYVRIVKR